MQEYKYDMFISYSHKDKKWGRWLYKNLTRYNIPKELVGTKNELNEVIPKKFNKIFRDEDRTPAHSKLSKIINDALENSKYLIVICSPNSRESKWVNEEIKFFKKIHGEDKVLAIIVDGEPNATYNEKYDNQIEAFPEALRYEVDKDGNSTKVRTEPLAVNAKGIAEGKLRAKVRLIAGLLGLDDFQILMKDELKRIRNEKLLKTLITTLILLLSVFSLYQWDKSEEQTNIANSNLAKFYKKQADQFLDKKMYLDSFDLYLKALSLNIDDIKFNSLIKYELNSNYFKVDDIFKMENDFEVLFVNEKYTVLKNKDIYLHNNVNNERINITKYGITNIVVKDNKMIYSTEDSLFVRNIDSKKILFKEEDLRLDGEKSFLNISNDLKYVLFSEYTYDSKEIHIFRLNLNTYETKENLVSCTECNIKSITLAEDVDNILIAQLGKIELLNFENEGIIKSIPLSENVQKIINYKNELYILNKESELYKYNISLNKRFKILGIGNDFFISNDKLFVLDNKIIKNYPILNDELFIINDEKIKKILSSSQRLFLLTNKKLYRYKNDVKFFEFTDYIKVVDLIDNGIIFKINNNKLNSAITFDKNIELSVFGLIRVVAFLSEKGEYALYNQIFDVRVKNLATKEEYNLNELNLIDNIKFFDSSTLIYSKDNQIVLYDFINKNEVYSIKEKVNIVDFLYENKRKVITVALENSVINIYKNSLENKIKTINTNITSEIKNIAFHKETESVIVLTKDGRLFKYSTKLKFK
jgi:WD40 repeat protein